MIKMSSFRFGQAEIASKDFHKDRQVTDQPVITTRIYVLHKITIEIYILHKFWFSNSREETANPRLATMYKGDQPGLEAGS